MGSNNNPIRWAANQLLSTDGHPFDTKTGAIAFTGAATTTLHDITATFSPAAATFAGRSNPFVNALTAAARVTMAYHTQGSAGAVYETGRITSETAGGYAAAWVMAEAGALVGSEFPILGNIIGGGIGLGIGYFGGSNGGGLLYDWVVGSIISSNVISNRSYVHDLNPTPSYPWVGGLASPLGLTKSSETMNIPPYKDVSFSVDTVSWMDPSTGVSKPVHSVVSLNNSANAPTGTRYDGLRGNVYSPGNINVGQELNALDQIAREQALGLLARPSGNQTAVSPTPGSCTGPGLTSPSLPGANVSSTPSGQYHSTSHYASIGSGGMVTGLPVVLDLNGNGVEISLSTKAAFDYDGDGFREPTAWVAPGDGFLVIDLNADGTRGAGDGKIDQARELVLSMWGPAGSTDLQAVDGNNAGLPMAA